MEEMEERKFNRLLKVLFTPPEKIEMSEQIASAIRDLKKSQDDLATVKAQFQSKIKEHEAEIANLCERINSGWEMRSIGCREVKDYTNFSVYVFRDDTEEMIEERAMEGEERQGTLPLGEEWRIVDEFPDYAVSNLGNIKRITHGEGSRSKHTELLFPTPNDDGYPQVLLYANGERSTFTVHRLVAKVFLGERPEGKEVNHKDGNKTNCSVSNLEYITKSENLKHSYETGLRKPISFPGEKNPMAKLTDEEVIEIKKMRNNGVHPKELAEQFGISESRIRHLAPKQNDESGNDDLSADLPEDANPFYVGKKEGQDV